MKIEGTVKLIKEMQVFDSGFMKQEMVVETDDKFPQTIPIEFIKANTELLQEVTEGEKVSVSINIRGREWTSPKGEVKHFVGVEGWKIDVLSSREMQPEAPAPAPRPANTVPEEESDLPF